MSAHKRSISGIGSVSFGWLHEQCGFQFDEPFFLNPHIRLARERQIQDFVASRFPGDPIYNMEAHLGQVEYRQRPVSLVGAIQPNLILGAALGAQFVFYGDKDPDITPTPLADIREIDSLGHVDWAKRWPVNMLLDQVHRARVELGDHFFVVPPFFWDTSGRATIHGVVTTAQKLMGERIFMEMVDNPRFVRELFQWIADSYARLIELFADVADIEITGLHYGECSLCMIGPDCFTDFVLPCMNELAQRLGPLRLHSCGHSDHLLDSFQEVRPLASLNVGSHTSVARIRDRLPNIQIDLIPDTQLLTYGAPEDIDAWVRQCLEENRDGPLQFQYHLESEQFENNCQQIHRTLRSLEYASERMKIY